MAPTERRLRCGVCLTASDFDGRSVWEEWAQTRPKREPIDDGREEDDDKELDQEDIGHW